MGTTRVSTREPAMNPTTLEELLCSLFASTEALRAFLRRRRDGNIVIQWLPGPGTPLRLAASHAVALLERRGDLDRAFFRALAADFPDHAQDIAIVAAEHGHHRSTGRARVFHAFVALFDDSDTTSLGSASDLYR